MKGGKRSFQIDAILISLPNFSMKNWIHWKFWINLRHSILRMQCHGTFHNAEISNEFIIDILSVLMDNTKNDMIVFVFARIRMTCLPIDRPEKW